MCKGGPSRIMRHNGIRDILLKAIRGAGFTIGFEHSGDLPDGRKPGDINAYNWKQRKHPLIDVSITNPLAAHNATELLDLEPGGAAKRNEKQKSNK